jgi:hypothetical protein
LVVSTSRGNIGEYLVMADLLYHDFDAYIGNRNNAAFDIACWSKSTNRATRIRVKTTSNSSAVWTVKKSGEIFLDMQPDDDFVAIVDIAKGTKERLTYVVPTSIVLDHLQSGHAFYVSHPKKDGAPRKSEQGMRNLCFYGEDKPTDCGYAYDKKFKEYVDAWDQLR